MNGDVADVEDKFDDIRVARNAFNSWSRQIDLRNIKEDTLRKFGDFNRKLRNIDRVLRKTISNLDVSNTGRVDQFDDAIDAYAPSGNDLNNVKYRRELLQLQTSVRENGCISKSEFCDCYLQACENLSIYLSISKIVKIVAAFYFRVSEGYSIEIRKVLRCQS